MRRSIERQTLANEQYDLTQQTYRVNLPEIASVKVRLITTKTPLCVLQNDTLLIDRHGLDRTITPARLTSIANLLLPRTADTRSLEE